MPNRNINEFFNSKNTIEELSKEDNFVLSDYLAPIKSFARITYNSIYVIDYQSKNFEYVSDNPLFLCGNTAEEVQEKGYAFYFENVVEEDLELLLKINQIGFDFFEKTPIEERLNLTISYDFKLKTKTGQAILINHKLTPIFLNSNGKMWKAVCLVSLSSNKTSGNIEVYNQKQQKYWEFDITNNLWEEKEKIQLTQREREILQLSVQGYTVNEISEKAFISSDTVKFHRRKLYEKLEVANIAEAIAFATNNKLL